MFSGPSDVAPAEAVSNFIKLMDLPQPVEPGKSFILKFWVNPHPYELQLLIDSDQSWQTNTPIQLKASQTSYIQPVRITVSDQTPASTVPLQVSIIDQGIAKQTMQVPIEVIKVEKVRLYLEGAPNFIVQSRAYDLSLVIENMGNAELTLIPYNVKELLHAEQATSRFTLKPKQVKRLPLRLQIDTAQSAGTISFNYGVKALEGDKIFSQGFTFAFYRNLNSTQKLKTVPSKIRAYRVINGSRYDSGYAVAGQGVYNQKLGHRLEYSLNLSERFKSRDSGHTTQGYVEWRSPQYLVKAGDFAYDVEDFISSPTKAKGGAVGYTKGKLNLLAYTSRSWDYMRNVASNIKERKNAVRIKWLEENWEASGSFHYKQIPEKSSRTVKQAALGYRYDSKNRLRTSLEYAHQFAGQDAKFLSPTRKPANAAALRLELLCLPKAFVNVLYERVGPKFVHSNNDRRQRSITIQGKSYGRSNWLINYYDYTTNLYMLAQYEAPHTQSVQATYHYKITPLFNLQTSQIITNRKDRKELSRNDSINGQTSLGFMWALSPKLSLSLTENLSYNRYYSTKYRCFPTSGQRWYMSYRPISWLYTSWNFENGKTVSNGSVTPNRTFGYSATAQLAKSSLNIGYQTSLPPGRRTKTLRMALHANFFDKWRLGLEIQSRSGFKGDNDYRWHISLDRQFDLVVGQDKEPGSLSGSILNYDQIRLPNHPIIDVSGYQVLSEGNRYYIDNLPLGQHTVYLVNPPSGCIESQPVPHKVELTSKQPKQNHDIQLVQGCAIYGKLIFLKKDENIQDLKQRQTGSPKEGWQEFFIDNIAISLSNQDSGEVLRTTCNENGNFKFASVRPGEWNLKPIFDEKDAQLGRYELLDYPNQIQLSPGSRYEIEIRAQQKTRHLKIIQ